MGPNAKGARLSAPRNFPRRLVYASRSSLRLRRSTPATSALAVEILLGALEDGPGERRYRCGCGASFEWPGLLDAHRLAVHEFEAAA